MEKQRQAQEQKQTIAGAFNETFVRILKTVEKLPDTIKKKETITVKGESERIRISLKQFSCEMGIYPKWKGLILSLKTKFGTFACFYQLKNNQLQRKKSIHIKEKKEPLVVDDLLLEYNATTQQYLNDIENCVKMFADIAELQELNELNKGNKTLSDKNRLTLTDDLKVKEERDVKLAFNIVKQLTDFKRNMFECAEDVNGKHEKEKRCPMGKFEPKNWDFIPSEIGLADLITWQYEILFKIAEFKDKAFVWKPESQIIKEQQESEAKNQEQENCEKSLEKYPL